MGLLLFCVEGWFCILKAMRLLKVASQWVRVVTNQEKLVLIFALFSIFVSHLTFDLSIGVVSMRLQIIAGVLALFYLLRYHSSDLKKLPLKWPLLALIMLVGLNAFKFHSSMNLEGVFYDPTGSLVLISFILLGLLAALQSQSFILSLVYVFAVIVGIDSYRVAFFNSQGFSRFFGIFEQSDVLAEIIGLGLLLNAYFYTKFVQHKYRTAFFGIEAMLAGVLYLSGTRFVIVTSVVLSLVLFWYLKAHRKEVAFLYAAAAAIFLIFSFTIHVTRITGVADYGSSVSYRLELQNITLRQVQSVPLLGVGVGNIEHVIPCQKLLSVRVLRKTCADGFIFSSSHNIFLDRILQFGLLAGLLYLAIFGMTILRALHAKLTAELVVMLLLELSICLYFLSNVSLPEIELLLFTLNCNLLVRTI